MKRAALIVTDARYVEWFDQSLGHGCTITAELSERLLADLRTLINVTHDEGSSDEMAAADRVRALLPEEEGEDE
jgi:hypothetical protein